jgi:tetratricopeptide (TPR) repeat protein
MRYPKAATVLAASVRPSWLMGFLIVLITAIVLGPVVHYGFVTWDDDWHVYENSRLLALDWKEVGAFWRAPYAHLYIPLTYTIWAGVVWLTQTLTPGTLDARLFHSLNLVLHLGSMLIVYRLLMLILRRQASMAACQPFGAAAIAALLFGLHPLQVEAVSWVSGFRDVLCGWWALLAVWQLMESMQSSSAKRRWMHDGFATAAYALALLSKPAAVVVPGLAALIAMWGWGQRWRLVRKVLSFWLLMAIAWSVWSKLQQPDTLLGYIPSWWDRPLVVADTLWFYVWKLIWPVNLVPDYGRTPQWVVTQGWTPVVGVLILGLGLVLGWGQRALAGLRLSVGVFIAGLLPVLGLIPFAFQAYSTVADRYVYLAMLGPAIGLGWLLYRTVRGNFVTVVGLALVMLLSWRTATQIKIWQDTETLFTHTLRVNPRSTLAHNNLGIILAQAGQLDKAITHFRHATRLQPNYPEPHYNLGKGLQIQGRLSEAISQYRLALQLRPNWPQAHNHLGLALATQGKSTEAVAQYAQALLRQPHAANVYYNLGNALLDLKRYDEAIVAYHAALRWRPDWALPATRLAMLLTTQAGAPPKAVREAVALAERACRTTRYQDASALYALAVAYQAAGQSAAAERIARQARMAAKTAGNETLIRDMDTRLPFFKQRTLSHEGS